MTFVVKKIIRYLFADIHGFTRQQDTINFFPFKGRSHEEKLLFFWILSKLPPPPSPQFEQLYIFLNAKNVDLSHIQNDLLSKILLK